MSTQTNSRRVRTVILSLGALLGFVGFVSCGGGAESVTQRMRPDHDLPAAEPIGTEGCLLCHEKKDQTLAGSHHWVKVDSRAPVSTDGCESCHGPGSVHAENRTSDEKVVDILTFGPDSMLSSRQQNAACLKCHKRDHSGWQGGKHHQNGVACASCHTVHGSGKDTKAVAQLESCGSCHQKQKLAAERVSHHPLREGKMQCTDCHDPHGTGREANLVATSVNDLCNKCHTEKRGPNLWEHPPVMENCTTCHDPHGSIHNKMLVSNLPFLCQRCHSDQRHPGTLYDKRGTFEGSAPANRVFAEGCANCHSRIHGSNHPSGHTFLR